MKIITSCRVCGNKDIKDFLDLGKQPFANSLLDNLQKKEKSYPLSLCWCSDCNLVQLKQTASPKELFSNYFWVTATSSTARKQASVFCDEILSRINNFNSGYVLEVGSNDGTFLQPFIDKNIKVLGIDPAQNIVDIANKNNIPSICKFFGNKSAKETLAEYGPAKVIIARNVLAHVANLHDFVEGMHTCLEDDGILAIEVHYAKKIFQELQYDSIYHEHLCYFTLKSIERLLNLHNLYIFDVRQSPISGGALVVYAKKSKSEELSSMKTYRAEESKLKVNEFKSWQNFANKVFSHRDKLLKLIKKSNQLIVGYGASARSSTILNFCGINNKYISVIADQNNLKHNHYTAGTHILIDSPENVMKKNPDCVFILAWNFGEEISQVLKDKYHYRGKCIIPLPNPPKVVDLTD